MANQTPLPALDSWKFTEIKLIAFPLSPPVSIEHNWWSDLTGAECTSTRKRLQRVDRGPFQGRDFTLAVDVERITWMADFLPDPELSLTPMIGSFIEVRDWFSEVMLRWLEGFCPAIKRLAFAGKLVLPTESREAAYETLKGYLPCVEIDTASREFMYRINRPRNSTTGVPGLRINRLVTWSAVKVSMQWKRQVTIGNESGMLSQTSLDGCLAQLDINSSEDRTDEIPHDSLPALWSELVQNGTELTERGDIR
jgi:hypothetical protein